MSVIASSAIGATIQWNGSVSGDVTDGNNWNGGVVPGAADVAEIPGGALPNSPDLLGTSPTWDRLNLFGSTTISDSIGGGTINLTNGGIGLFSGGSENSVISVPLNLTGRIQTNGDHSVTFDADVVANKVESFATAVATYNAALTVSNGFTTLGASGEVVVNSAFNWNFPGEKGYNGGGGALVAGAGSSLNFGPGSQGILNLFGNSTVRAGGNNTITGATDLWSRNASNTFDLNGFSQAIEFLGTNGGTNLNIDFGSTPGPNDLVWDASFNSNGTYAVLNFEPGIDRLEFGQFGGPLPFTDPAKLAQITINGAPYAQTNPGNGMDWWTAIPTPNPNDHPDRQIAVFMAVPEPGSAACVSLLLMAGALRRNREER